MARTITRTLDDYVALCGAGYSDDGTVLVVPHDRAIAVFWCLNDVCGRRRGWEFKMEHLSSAVLNLARLSHFAGPVIFIIGGSANVWHMPVSFNTARNAVLKILRDAGCTAFSGEDLFVDLSWQRHVDPRVVRISGTSRSVTLHCLAMTAGLS